MSIKQWISILDNKGNVQIINFDAFAPNRAALTWVEEVGLRWNKEEGGNYNLFFHC